MFSQHQHQFQHGSITYNGTTLPLAHQRSHSTTFYVGRVQMVKILSGTQAGVDNMLAFLLGRHDSNPQAYNHTNITPLQFIDVEQLIVVNTRSIRALATPLYSRGDVLTYVQNQSSADLIALAAQIANGVEHLHKHGIIHGNLYPGNIFITDEGSATITDISINTLSYQFLLDPHVTIPFGISSLYHPRELLSPPTNALVQPTGPMEIYSLGSTTYAVFAKKTPFLGVGPIRTISQAVVKVITYGHRHLEKPAEIHENIWDLLWKCWSYDPTSRPDASYVAETLRRMKLH